MPQVWSDAAPQPTVASMMPLYGDMTTQALSLNGPQGHLTLAATQPMRFRRGKRPSACLSWAVPALRYKPLGRYVRAQAELLIAHRWRPLMLAPAPLKPCRSLPGVASEAVLSLLSCVQPASAALACTCKVHFLVPVPCLTRLCARGGGILSLAGFIGWCAVLSGTSRFDASVDDTWATRQGATRTANGVPGHHAGKRR